MLPGVDYRLYPVMRPHPSISHLTNMVGASLALTRVGKHDVAVAGSYDAALARAPDNGQIRGNRAVACLGAGRFAEARKSTQTTLDLLPANHFLRPIAVRQLRLRRLRCRRRWCT